MGERVGVDVVSALTVMCPCAADGETADTMRTSLTVLKVLKQLDVEGTRTTAVIDPEFKDKYMKQIMDR